jgi:hypothetical protein
MEKAMAHQLPALMLISSKVISDIFFHSETWYNFAA